jgi:D-3-phosphoglycerate dehydrogenase
MLNVIILDDYQDAVRKLRCASLLEVEGLHAKVFTNTVKGIGQLSVRLRDADVLVTVRERTSFPRQLLEKLPKLRLLVQTGKVGPHIDVDTCTRLGIAVAEGTGSPTSTAELTWALIMAASMVRTRLMTICRRCSSWKRKMLSGSEAPPSSLRILTTNSSSM